MNKRKNKTIINPTILSILCGIAGMFGWGLYDFLGGVFSRQIGSFKAFFWSQLAGLASALVLAIVFTPTFNLTFLVMVLLPIAAIVYAAGYLFFFKGFELGSVSIVAAAMNLWAVFTMLFAFVFMGQRLSTIQTAGVLMIICGVTVASIHWNDLKSHRFQLSSGIKEAVLGAFFFGIFWNISEIISEEVGWLLTTLIVKFWIVIFLLFFSFLLKRKIGLANTSSKTIFTVGLMGVIEAGAVAVVNYGLTNGDAILITPIASALSIVTIILAIVFLKDKVTRLQGLGIVTTIAGIIVTAF